MHVCECMHSKKGLLKKVVGITEHLVCKVTMTTFLAVEIKGFMCCKFAKTACLMVVIKEQLCCEFTKTIYMAVDIPSIML